MYIVILISTLALLTDIASARIPNELFVFGLFISQINILWFKTVQDATYALIDAIVILIVLFPIFCIGCLGAGDIKVLMLLPSAFGLKESMRIIIIAFVVGSVIGVVKLIQNKDLLERIKRASLYLLSIYRGGPVKAYDIPPSIVKTSISKNQIHFTIPIFISLLMKAGGII